ncbi:hypothetical protein ACFSM5_19400 [Lacibacterium aquatile]|uniref:Glycosyltransferase RgtA/B/C/D-like domain-containing protein n=1 Tax=Lacibacterium aquatile TaxID=1168082 RepID=A0ABW5DZ71_9PROT
MVEVLGHTPKKPLGRTAAAVGVVLAIVFAALAFISIRSGFTIPTVERLWSVPVEALASSGGQWLTIILVLVFRQIPGVQPWFLVLVTVGIAALMAAYFCAWIIRRGWKRWEAVVLTLSFAAHPFLLYLAVSGQPRLLSLGIFAALVFWCSRLEAIGDVQSQMTAGLVLGLLMVSDPNGIYVLMAVLTVLPIFYRQIVDGKSAIAGYLLVGLPPLIALSAVMILQLLLSTRAPRYALAAWSGPLHGIPADFAGYDWLILFGGRPGLALGAIVALILVVCPLLILMLVRLFRERRRPGLVALALFVPLAAGSVGSWFWHVAASWIYPSYVIAGVAIWLMTSTLDIQWRRWVLVLGVIGTVAAWVTPPVWFEQDKASWRASLTVR